MKFTIAVSGAAQGECVDEKGQELARQIGEEIARQDCILLTGATTGLPHYSTIGAKKENGFSIGFSPANTKKEHLETYKLPDNYLDCIIYTGFGYSGRNLMLIRAADAVIFICGRIGTLNEFTNAFEEERVIGVLTQSGGMADEIKEIVEIAKRGPGEIFYSDDPVELVQKVAGHLRSKHSGNQDHKE